MNECIDRTRFYRWAEGASDYAVTYWDTMLVELYDKAGTILHIWQYVPETGLMCPAALG